MIGLVHTLRFLGRLQPGSHRIDTPVGVVTAELLEDGSVSFENVASRRTCKGIAIDVPGYGAVRGDVAWGGNWFFITEQSPVALELRHVGTLTAYTRAIREALRSAGIAGEDGHEIDHIELSAPSDSADADSRNFVLCPDGEYDRSPCGTGTSAKLACLAADGLLLPGAVYRQESFIGSRFEGSVSIRNGEIFPRIRGRASIMGRSEILFEEDDRFRWGVRE